MGMEDILAKVFGSTFGGAGGGAGGGDGSGGSAPAAAPATPAPSSGGAGGLDPAIAQQMKAAVSDKAHLPMTMNPKAKNNSLGVDLGMGVASMFVPFFTGALQKHMKAQKEAQIMESVSVYSQLDSALERAQQMSGETAEQAMDPKSKTRQLWQQMPEFKALFDPHNPNSKKLIKNFQKAFLKTDWMNPEKTQSTVQFQGLQRYKELKPASKLAEHIHGMKDQIMGQQSQGQPQGQAGGQPPAGGGPPQPQAGQQPQAGGGAGGGAGEMSGPAQAAPLAIRHPDIKAVESYARISETQQASAARLAEQHNTNIQRHQDKVDDRELRQNDLQDKMAERKREFDKREQDHTADLDFKRQVAKDMKDFRSESLRLRKEMNDENLAIKREQIAARLDQSKEKSRVPIQLQSRLIQTDLIDEQIDHISSMVDNDQHLKSMMGPLRGTALKVIQAKRWDPAVQQFSAAVESLDALFAQVHGYRGGAHVHVIFKAATGDISFDPEAFKAGLAQYKVLNGNLRSAAAKRYKNDSFFGQLETQPNTAPSADEMMESLGLVSKKPN